MSGASSSVAAAAQHAAAPATPRVAVVQDGARLHYALPVALKRAGILQRVFTEFFVTPGSVEGLLARAVRMLSSSAGRRMEDRRCAELDRSLVRRNPWLVLRQILGRRRFASDQEFFRWSSEIVGRWIQREGLDDANALMGFVLNIDPTLCAWARQRGLVVVGDQMGAPMNVFMRHCLDESQRWPAWENMGTPQQIRERYAVAADVEERTWREVEHVTCASEYVRRGLESQGVERKKISVIPYPIDASRYTVADRRGRSGPVTVGFVGRASLLKGAPYFFDVARRFKGEQVKFVMVGPVHLDEKIAREQKGVVELVGGVPRSEVARYLAQFDIFFFPSVSEGSSGAVMEAMCSGLPVVVSSNSGSVARDGIEGFSAAYDDVDALAAHVERLVSDENLRLEMGQAARALAESLNLVAYSAKLGELFRTLLAARAH